MRAPIHRFERCGMEVRSVCQHMGHRLADVSVRSRPHCAHFVVESIRGDYSMVGDGEQLTEVTVSAGQGPERSRFLCLVFFSPSFLELLRLPVS